MSTHSVSDNTATSRTPHLLSGAPFVGHLFEFAKDALGFMRRAVAHNEQVVDFYVPGERISMVTSADMTHQILVKHYQDFRKAERDVGVMAHVLGKGLVTVNDYTAHKKQRKMAQPGFHFRRIKGYAETMIDYTDTYVQSWPDSGVRDINDDMFKLTLYIVSKTLFNSDMGAMRDHTDSIGSAMHDVQEQMNKGFQSMFVMPTWMPMPGKKKLLAAKQDVTQSIQEMIDGRRNPDGSFDSGDDLLSMLLETEYEDGTHMPEDLLMDELITLLSAGHETTSNAMTWVFYLLAKHPNIQERVYKEVDALLGDKDLVFDQVAELAYTEQVIKESMRLLPPVWTMNTRRANKDITINGYHFKKDKHVFISPYTNHLNPNYFPEPERFDPDRFLPDNEAQLPRYAYMPFGGGNRVCIGNSFAMMESKIILAKMIQKFRFETCSKTKFDPQPQVTLTNKDGMWLNIVRR